MTEEMKNGVINKMFGSFKGASSSDLTQQAAKSGKYDVVTREKTKVIKKG